MTSTIEMPRVAIRGAPAQFGYPDPAIRESAAQPARRSRHVADAPGMRALIAPSLALLAAVAVALLLHARSSGIF